MNISAEMSELKRYISTCNDSIVDVMDVAFICYYWRIIDDDLWILYVCVYTEKDIGFTDVVHHLNDYYELKCESTSNTDIYDALEFDCNNFNNSNVSAAYLIATRDITKLRLRSNNHFDSPLAVTLIDYFDYDVSDCTNENFFNDEAREKCELLYDYIIEARHQFANENAIDYSDIWEKKWADRKQKESSNKRI